MNPTPHGIALGEFGVRPFVMSGFNTPTTTYRTIWSSATLYTFRTSAAVMKCSSSNANDVGVVGSEGTGARTIFIHGIDGNYAPVSETVTLNGQTQVSTINSYLMVNGMRVLTAGSGGQNAGTVYAGTGSASSGVPQTTVEGIIAATTNVSAACIYGVPAGCQVAISNIIWCSNAASSQPTNFQIVSQRSGYLTEINHTLLNNSNTLPTINQQFPVPLVFREKTLIQLQVACGSGTATVAALASGHTTGIAYTAAKTEVF